MPDYRVTLAFAVRATDADAARRSILAALPAWAADQATVTTDPVATNPDTAPPWDEAAWGAAMAEAAAREMTPAPIPPPAVEDEP